MEGYTTEEVIESCIDYISDGTIIGVPVPKHEGKLCGRGCRCFGSDRTPGVAPQGVFRSRTVSPTVAKWFVPDARGTMDSVYRFGPL
jgi:hypothetical protein